MSRIGRMPIAVPAGVDVQINGSTVTVKGPKGSLTGTFNDNMSIAAQDGHVTVSRPDDSNSNKSLHGLTRTLIANMIEGVTNGFKKELQINGIGYRAEVKGTELILTVGYSHKVNMKAPEGITIEVPEPTKIIISGPDKQKVGQFASEVRDVRPPEPYKGKGIKYIDEHIRRKEGKAGKGGK